jgi:hypothetical protein
MRRRVLSLVVLCSIFQITCRDRVLPLQRDIFSKCRKLDSNVFQDALSVMKKSIVLRRLNATPLTLSRRNRTMLRDMCGMSPALVRCLYGGVEPCAAARRGSTPLHSDDIVLIHCFTSLDGVCMAATQLDVLKLRRAYFKFVMDPVGVYHSTSKMRTSWRKFPNTYAVVCRVAFLSSAVLRVTRGSLSCSIGQLPYWTMLTSLHLPSISFYARLFDLILKGASACPPRVAVCGASRRDVCLLAAVFLLTWPEAEFGTNHVAAMKKLQAAAKSDAERAEEEEALQEAEDKARAKLKSYGGGGSEDGSSVAGSLASGDVESKSSLHAHAAEGYQGLVPSAEDVDFKFVSSGLIGVRQAGAGEIKMQGRSPSCACVMLMLTCMHVSRGTCACV